LVGVEEWTTVDPNQPGIGRCATTQCLETKALLLQLSLLVEPATKPDAPFPTLEYSGSSMLCQACSPPLSELVERERTKTACVVEVQSLSNEQA
jgi:hypothetical protein